LYEFAREINVALDLGNTSPWLSCRARFSDTHHDPFVFAQSEEKSHFIRQSSAGDHAQMRSGNFLPIGP